MSLIVNTNMTSLVTQNYLSTSQSQLSQATQRLASGLRINSAADDAAGYAISQRMTAQVNGDNTAIQNTNNAVSLAQTAEGSLAQITTNLQSIRNLAVESSNATNSASDRQSLNNEAQQLLSEIDRVASSASFNGVNLLDGSFQSQQFQVGANAGDTITIGSIASARIGALGTSTTYSATAVTPTAIAAGGGGAAGGLTINGVAIGASASSSATDVATAINAANAGVTAKAETVVTGGAAVAAAPGQLSTGDLVINGTNVIGNFSNAQDLVNGINAQVGGVTASLSGGKLQLTAADGSPVTVSTSAAGATASGFSAGATNASSNEVVVSGNSAFNIVAGTGGSGGFAAGSTAASGTTTGLALSSLDISSVSGASSALTALDNALNSVNASNGSLGAYQNRFQSAVANLQSESQNLTAARSTIEDTDFASETAAETRASVLQQAGVAVLGQANSQPQQILSLLQHL